jgi:hypothetical protein
MRYESEMTININRKPKIGYSSVTLDLISVTIWQPKPLIIYFQIVITRKQLDSGLRGQISQHPAGVKVAAVAAEIAAKTLPCAQDRKTRNLRRRHPPACPQRNK